MAPVLPTQSIDPALAVSKFISSQPRSSQEDPRVLAQMQQPITRTPTPYTIDPQDLLKPVIPVVIQTPKQVMQPMSQEIKEPMPQQVRDNLIAGNVSTQSLKEPTKYLSKADLKKKLIDYGVPQEERGATIDALYNKGYKIEGYDPLAGAFNGQAPVKVAPQISYGENKLQDQKQPGSLRRGIASLGGDMGNLEWLNPVGRLTEIIDNAVQKIPVANTESRAQDRIDKKIQSLSPQEIANYQKRFNESKAAQKLFGNVDNFIREKEANLIESIAGGGVKDVGGPNISSMILNSPGSLLKTTSATARGITNPVDTLQGLYKLAATKEGHQVIKDRYGTIDNFAKSLEQDPIGVASDLLTVVQGGATLGSKVAGLAGKTELAGKLGGIANTAGGAADLGLGVGMDKLNAGIGNIASKPLRIAAKTALAPTQPLTAGKEVLGGVVSKERADKMLSNMNRITKPQQEKFAEMAGETVGEFLNNRGITEGGDKAISKIANKFVESIDKADKGLEAIKGEYKDEFLSLMGKEAAEFAENTLSPDAKRMRELSNKADTRGLTMTESNELKRFYQRNNKFTYGKDITAGEKTIRATNIDNAVRKRQFDIAEQNGFSNLKQINKETQAFKYLLDKLSKNEAGRLGNNAMGLTDWIVAGQVAIDPSSIALLVGKKVAESNWFRSNVVKIINKLSGHQNKGDLTLDLGKIQGIQSEKDLNKYLALPLKENVTSPTLSTMNSANGNQGAIVGTNAIISPKPTTKQIIEKVSTQAKIKPKTSIALKSEGPLIKGVPELGSNQRPIITPQTFKQGVAQKTTIEKGVAKKPGTTKDIVAKLDQQIRAKKQGETPVKTVPKKTDTKIEPKKATVDQELQNIAQKVKEKSIAKKENGSIMDGMKKEPLYHVSSTEIKNLSDDKILWTTSDSDYAMKFGKKDSRILYNVEGDLNKLDSYSSEGKKIIESINKSLPKDKQFSTLFNDDGGVSSFFIQDKQVVSKLRGLGYDAVITSESIGGSQRAVGIINPNKVKLSPKSDTPVIPKKK